jgi:site-specific recombinase XerD
MVIQSGKLLKHRKAILLHGCLNPYLTSFVHELSKKGYANLTIRSYFRTVTHFDIWLQKKHVSLQEIDNDVVKKFAKHKCYCHRRKKPPLSKLYINRVKRFISYLSRCDVIPNQFSPIKDPLPPLLVKFKEFLHSEGLKTITIDNYLKSLLRLLPQLGNNPKKYNVTTIRKIFYNASKNNGIEVMKNFAAALKRYLRFLAIEKLCRTNLDAAVPVAAQWRLSSLPKYLPAIDLERVISSCNLDEKQGLRDRAILLFLGRLGLRASDIVNMLLDDINWNEGTIRVCGKGRKEIVLPLPQEVGDALLAYIKKARAQVPIEHVFLCLKAPFRSLPSSANVSTIVKTALRRAGIVNPPSHGANLMRHSAATALLQNGASLETVSAVLRHASLNMTGYYAKVDLRMLNMIVQPWPDGASC